MLFSFTQILLTIFLIFALSRVILRFKGGNVSVFGLLFWGLLFFSAICFVIFPSITGAIAHWMGISRGVDAIVYTSIVILFYLVFRSYVNFQNMKHELTRLVEKIALKELEKNKNEKSSKN
jgi:small membrane protein